LDELLWRHENLNEKINWKEVMKLVSRGADPNRTMGFSNFTLLMSAVFDKRADACQFLICKGANVNVHNRQGETALMLAAANNDRKICALLAVGGADFDAPRGLRPPHYVNFDSTSAMDLGNEETKAYLTSLKAAKDILGGLLADSWHGFYSEFSKCILGGG
jgi:ankyrin repeat protein